SRCVIVTVVARSPRRRDYVGCGDRRPGLSHDGDSNSGARQAFPNCAHGALPHRQIARSLKSESVRRARTTALGKLYLRILVWHCFSFLDTAQGGLLGVGEAFGVHAEE